jgi:hypothetical protein
VERGDGAASRALGVLEGDVGRAHRHANVDRRGAPPDDDFVVVGERVVEHRRDLLAEPTEVTQVADAADLDVVEVVALAAPAAAEVDFAQGG